MITQEMGQFINALVQDNQNKNMRIDSLTRDSQVHAEILRQHQMGQQVIAEVKKCMMTGHHQGQQQQQPHQGVTGTGPVVTEVDDHDGDRLDFSNAPSPNAGPPNDGGFGVQMNEVPQIPTSMEMVPRL